MSADSPYQRVLLKLSGEAFLSSSSQGIDLDKLQEIADQIKQVHSTGVELALVLGAGNLCRGKELSKKLGITPSKADEIGMVATVLNGLSLKEALIHKGCPAQVFGSFSVSHFVQPYHPEKVTQALQNQEIVIFVGGTGHPFFTTDTAASLRAIEIDAEILLKATKVDGVYSSDPKKDSSAKKYDSLTYSQVLEQDLKAMDATAISLCRDQKLPVCVFNMYEKENLLKVIQKNKCGTLIQ